MDRRVAGTHTWRFARIPLLFLCLSQHPTPGTCYSPPEGFQNARQARNSGELVPPEASVNDRLELENNYPSSLTWGRVTLRYMLLCLPEVPSSTEP